MVAFSGGEDSFLSFKILSKKYDCIPCYARLLDDLPDFSVFKDFKVEIIDLRKEFKEKVIDYFLQSLQAGKTPNPCVICNTQIKFGVFLEKIQQKFQPDFYATGHFASIKNGAIYKSADRRHDQTYYLCQLERDVIKKCIFPLGDMRKEAVSQKAKELGFIPRKSSTDLCFLRGQKIKDFLKEKITLKSGDMVSRAGKKINVHAGLELYTVGQKKIAHGHNEELFVFAKDSKKNHLILSSREDLFKEKITLKNINLLSDLSNNSKVRVKIRQHEEEKEVKISPSKKLIPSNPKELALTFTKEKAWAPCPGQYAAFYEDDRLLGGGEIVS